MVSVEKRIKRGWMKLKVKEIIEETHDTQTLILVNEEEGTRAFDYIAGQYLTFRFDHISEKPVVRSYTMSSSPCQKESIAVTVKSIENGFVSKHLCQDVKVGDVLRARGPIGRFCFNPDSDEKNLVMIAAGSGVTPFISIMREYQNHLGEVGYPSTMGLLVSFRSRNDLICWKDIESFMQHKSIHVMVTLSREESSENQFAFGRINDQLLHKFFQGKYDKTTFMTCGPDAMMNLTKDHLLTNNVEESHIKLESFS